MEKKVERRDVLNGKGGRDVGTFEKGQPLSLKNALHRGGVVATANEEMGEKDLDLRAPEKVSAEKKERYAKKTGPPLMKKKKRPPGILRLDGTPWGGGEKGSSL